MASLPKHDDLRLPALTLLSQYDSMKLKDFENLLAVHFKLTDDEVNQEYESGNGKIFYDRISWALSYMNMAGLIEKPKRALYKISDLGLKQMEQPDTIHTFIASEIQKRKSKQKSSSEISIEELTNQTPKEKLYDASNKIKASMYTDIIDLILSKSPRAFEALVVHLLQCMGYGGEIKSSGQVTQYTNDKGIDGIIKEDVLGLGRIHIQAKRNAIGNTIGREEIQKFVGALAVAQSNKGVFITTSTYTSGALDYANSLNGTTNVALIDGEKMAEYIYKYGLGMQVEQIIEIKKLDSDFWDSMEDAK